MTFIPITYYLAISMGINLLLLIIVGRIYWQHQKQQTEWRKAGEQVKQLQLELNNYQLDTIRYKLNPHLFKNTLNSIQSHAYQTYYALDKLANVLDYILYESDHPYVTLKDEVDFALSLIEVNRLKLSPLFALNVKKKINVYDPLYEQKLIPPLICADLIENAFKHADLQSPDAFINVVFELKNNIFYFTVSNKVSSGSLIKKSKGGFGSDSLKKRLHIIYKENYQLDQFVEDEVYIAHLKINLLEHKAQMLAAGR